MYGKHQELIFYESCNKMMYWNCLIQVTKILNISELMKILFKGNLNSDISHLHEFTIWFQSNGFNKNSTWIDMTELNVYKSYGNIPDVGDNSRLLVVMIFHYVTMLWLQLILIEKLQQLILIIIHNGNLNIENIFFARTNTMSVKGINLISNVIIISSIYSKYTLLIVLAW